MFNHQNKCTMMEDQPPPTPTPTRDEAARVLASLPHRPIHWVKAIDLKYESIQQLSSCPVCFACGKVSDPEQPLSKCAKCQVAGYCQKSCQVTDWKRGGHKVACTSYARVGREMLFRSETDQETALAEIFARVRFYVCPYAVYKATELGQGFLFVQSDHTLAMMSLVTPKDSSGRAPLHPRSVLLHYLTMAEYDQEVCREDFEMTMLRTDLQTTLEHYNMEEEVVLLMRFRCGRVALGVAPLVPEYRLCLQLGREYYEHTKADSLHLNLDEE
jgi:MYND finger